MRGLRVTILGSGTAIPLPERFPAGVLIRGGGECVLVDLGPGVLRQLPRVGVDLSEITAVLLTHFHTDHCADLAALLFALRNPRYVGRPPLKLRAAAGLHELLTGLRTTWPRWLEAGDAYDLDVAEIGPGCFDLGALSVSATAVRHTDASLAYRVDHEGASVVVSGDVDAIEGLDAAARGADLLICDAAFPAELREQRHLSPGLAGQAAARAGVSTLCLTHFYPECRGYDLLAEARAEFAGEVVLAEDLAVFDLPPREGRQPRS